MTAPCSSPGCGYWAESGQRCDWHQRAGGTGVTSRRPVPRYSDEFRALAGLVGKLTAVPRGSDEPLYVGGGS